MPTPTPPAAPIDPHRPEGPTVTTTPPPLIEPAQLTPSEKATALAAAIARSRLLPAAS